MTGLCLCRSKYCTMQAPCREHIYLYLYVDYIRAQIFIYSIYIYICTFPLSLFSTPPIFFLIKVPPFLRPRFEVTHSSPLTLLRSTPPPHRQNTSLSIVFHLLRRLNKPNKCAYMYSPRADEESTRTFFFPYRVLGLVGGLIPPSPPDPPSLPYWPRRLLTWRNVYPTCKTIF